MKTTSWRWAAWPLALASAAAFADPATPGFYFGVGAGGASYSDSIPGEIRRAYDANPTYGVTTARMTDDSDTALKVTAGYRFLPWLSVEAAYADLGKAKVYYQLFSEVAGTTGTTKRNGTFDLTAFQVSALGEFPFTDRLSGLVRLGVASARLGYDETGTFLSTPTRFHGPTDTSTHAIAGLGLAWSFDSHWDARLDYERYFDVGSGFGLTTRDNGRFDHVDTLTLNLLYRL